MIGGWMPRVETELISFAQTRPSTGRRPVLFPVTRTLKDRVARSGDPAVVAEFYKVLALTARPQTLLRPRVVARVVWSFWV